MTSGLGAASAPPPPTSGIRADNSAEPEPTRDHRCSQCDPSFSSLYRLDVYVRSSHDSRDLDDALGGGTSQTGLAPATNALPVVDWAAMEGRLCEMGDIFATPRTRARLLSLELRCPRMVATTPKRMPYKLYGEAVYEHEFTVDLADGSTTTLGIVPATDSLQCGRGLLARVDGLERVLLDKHGASSMAALRDLERGWAQLDELKLSRAQFEQLERGWAQFEELRENSAQLDEYRSRKAEIEKLRSQMTSEQRKLDDVKTMAIIQHYEGTTGGTGPSVGTGTNSGSSAAPSARSTAVDEPAAKRRRHGGGQHSPAASLSAWPTHSALPHITCIVRVLNPGATTNERQYCAVVRTPSGEAWERVYGRDGPRPPSLVTGWEAALKRFGGIETTSDSASASATVEGPTLSSGMDPPSPGRSTEGSCTPGGPKGTIADLRRVIPQPSTSRTSMVTRGGGGRRTRSSQPRPLYDVLKDSALCVDGEDGMFVVLDKAVLDELRGHSGWSTA